jgi:glycosidase
MGVDGLRLDAVPYLYEREGTNCENLPETHRVLRRHIDERFDDRMLSPGEPVARGRRLLRRWRRVPDGYTSR